MRNLAIFWHILDAFASWMRVYLSLVEKVSKIGLFWLSLFLVYLPWVYSGCHLTGKYILSVMTLGIVGESVCFNGHSAYLDICTFVDVE